MPPGASFNRDDIRYGRQPKRTCASATTNRLYRPSHSRRRLTPTVPQQLADARMTNMRATAGHAPGSRWRPDRRLRVRGQGPSLVGDRGCAGPDCIIDWLLSLHIYTSQPCAEMRGSCRVQRSGESVWLVALTRIKVIHSGIHLVLKDAIRGPARCPADDEHAPAANIDPDGIRLIGGSSAHWPARRTAGPSLAPPTHRGHLRRFTRPAPASTAEPVTTTMAAAGTTRRCFGQRSIVPPSRASPSDGCRLWRHRACQLRVPAASEPSASAAIRVLASVSQAGGRSGPVRLLAGADAATSPPQAPRTPGVLTSCGRAHPRAVRLSLTADAAVAPAAVS